MFCQKISRDQPLMQAVLRGGFWGQWVGLKGSNFMNRLFH